MRVLWYSSPSLLSRLIRRVTHSLYSHIAIEVDGVVYEALGRGVVRREGDAAVQRMAEAAAQVELPITNEDERQAIYWLEGQVGNSYSLLGFIAAALVSLGLPAPVLSLNGQFICSALVATVLQICGYTNPLRDPRLETPESLAEMLGAEVSVCR